MKDGLDRRASSGCYYSFGVCSPAYSPILSTPSRAQLRHNDSRYHVLSGAGARLICCRAPRALVYAPESGHQHRLCSRRDGGVEWAWWRRRGQPPRPEQAHALLSSFAGWPPALIPHSRQRVRRIHIDSYSRSPSTDGQLCPSWAPSIAHLRAHGVNPHTQLSHADGTTHTHAGCVSNHRPT